MPLLPDEIRGIDALKKFSKYLLSSFHPPSTQKKSE